MKISLPSAPLLAAASLACLFAASCGPALVVDQKAGSGLRIGSLSFQGDGKQLAYAAADWNRPKKGEDEPDDESSDETTRTGSFQVTAIPPSGKPHAVEVEACAAGNAYRLHWSHQGRKLAVAARDALLVLTPKGKKKIKYEQAVLIESHKDCADKNPAGDILSLAWSPDDAQIAYSDGKDLFTISADGGAPTPVGVADLPGEPSDRLTLLEWSEYGWVVKRGSAVISVDPATKQGVVKHELTEKDDWVTTSPKGAIYVVTSAGQVQEIRPNGPKTVLSLQPLLKPKNKSKKKNGRARHQYVIELSPSGRYLAVAESLSEKGRIGSVLSVVSMPAAKSKAGGGKRAKRKKPAEEEDNAAGGGEETAADGDPADKPKRKQSGDSEE